MDTSAVIAAIDAEIARLERAKALLDVAPTQEQTDQTAHGFLTVARKRLGTLLDAVMWFKGNHHAHSRCASGFIVERAGVES